jgi:hypothetical protein
LLKCVGCKNLERWTAAKYRRAVAKVVTRPAIEVSKIETPMNGVATKNLQQPHTIIKPEKRGDIDVIPGDSPVAAPASANVRVISASWPLNQDELDEGP